MWRQLHVVVCVDRDLRRKDALFAELEERLRLKDSTLDMLTLENESKQAQLQATTAEAKRY